MPLFYPDINGYKPSYCSIWATVEGVPILGFKSLNYKSEVTEGETFGTSARRSGRTRGQVKHSGDCEIYQVDWEHILLPLVTRGGLLGIAEGSLTMSVTTSEKTNIDLTSTDALIGVRFLGPDKSGRQEGVDALTVKFNLSIMEILYKGIPVLR